MKILVVSNLFPPDVQGGYEILCEQVVRGLRSRGHEVVVLTSRTEALNDETTDSPSVRRLLSLTSPFPEPVTSGRFHRSRLHRANAAVMRATIESVRPDHIFIWSQLRLTLGCAEAAERSGVPVTYTFNDVHPTGFLPRRSRGTLRSTVGAWIDRLEPRTTLSSLKLAHTTCISATLKGSLIEAGVDIPDSRVIFQGIPIRRFPAYLDRARLSRPLKILYAGQLHPYKGVHTLLEAAAHLSASPSFPFSISIAGDGPADYKERLRGLVEKDRLPVRFLGKVGHEEISPLYRAHDIFVFPSIWREPFGLTHLEAMASGTPVVSTTEGGPGEFLVDRENALTFPKEDALALSLAIRELAGDEALAARVARNARSLVETRFTLDRYVAELEDFLGELHP